MRDVNPSSELFTLCLCNVQWSLYFWPLPKHTEFEFFFFNDFSISLGVNLRYVHIYSTVNKCSCVFGNYGKFLSLGAKASGCKVNGWLEGETMKDRVFLLQKGERNIHVLCQFSLFFEPVCHFTEIV